MNCSHLVLTNVYGNGTSGAYYFLMDILRPYTYKSSLFATGPNQKVGEVFHAGGTLDDAWEVMLRHLNHFPEFRGFSSWPYNLFYKQWNEYPQFDAKFFHWDRPAKDWAKGEFAFQHMRANLVKPDVLGWWTCRERVYGCDIGYDTDVASWQTWVDKYKQWNEDVRTYFEGKDNFLIIDPLSIDYGTTEPWTLANQICAWIGIQNVANVRYGDRSRVGGEKASLIDESGWDEDFTARWNEFEPQVNW